MLSRKRKGDIQIDIEALYIPKSAPAPQRDALCAYGAAELAQSLFGKTVKIEQTPSHYLLSWSGPASLDALGEAPLPALPFKAIERKGAGSAQSVSIEEQMEKLKRRSEILKAARKASGEAKEAIEASAPQTEPNLWFYMTCISLMGDKLANKLREYWEDERLLRASLRLFFEAFSEPFGALERLDEAAKSLSRKRGGEKISFPALDRIQLLNPESPKGVNLKKANGVKRGSMPSEFWLLEALKLIGMFHAGQSAKAGDGRLLIYVLDAERIYWRDLKQARSGIEKQRRSAHQALIDILATLELSEALLDYKEDPRRLVRGLFRVAYDKMSLHAYQVFSNSYLRVPPWIECRREESWRDLLKSQILFFAKNAVASQSDKDLEKNVDLHAPYKEFLASEQTEPLYAYVASYTRAAAAHIRKQNNPYALPFFNPQFLEEVATALNPKQEHFFANPSFRAVARAIYDAHIKGQYMKAKGLKWKYEIRYDLLHELQEKSIDPELFFETLCKFVASYGSENTRKLKEEGPSRASVTQEDLEAVLALMEEENPRKVMSALLAFGSLFPAKRAEKAEEETEMQEEAENQDEEERAYA